MFDLGLNSEVHRKCPGNVNSKNLGLWILSMWTGRLAGRKDAALRYVKAINTGVCEEQLLVRKPYTPSSPAAETAFHPPIWRSESSSFHGSAEECCFRRRRAGMINNRPWNNVSS